MTGTRSLFTLVRNCFGLVTGSCDRTHGNNSREKPPRPFHISELSKLNKTDTWDSVHSALSLTADGSTLIRLIFMVKLFFMFSI